MDIQIAFLFGGLLLIVAVGSFLIGLFTRRRSSKEQQRAEGSAAWMRAGGGGSL